MSPIKPDRRGRQAQGDARRADRDGIGRDGTSGAPAGLSGDERSAIQIGWGIGATIVAAVSVFDVLTRHHDTPAQGWIAPLIGEVSSALVSLLVFAVPAAVALWIRRARPRWWTAAALHLAAAAAYSVLHVTGFVLLRKLVTPMLLHHPYRFGPLPGEFLYEFAKDAGAYGLLTAGFVLVLSWRAPTRAEAGGAVAPAWFDIRDGGRLVRAPVAEILAVRSAGNYAEFLLRDGRRPLMRSSLSALEAALATRGFVRTHRSWLVNAAQVTGLRPEGSGDYAVELGAIEAPLSRRFPDALAALRT